MAASFAICTLLTNDGYLPGALALVAALRDLHPRPCSAPEVDFKTICLVTPETVDVSSIKLLRRAFDVVVGVEIIEPDDDKGLHLLGRLDLNQVLTKLHVFRLTQYSKVLFLDADVLPIRPLSHLLTLPHEFSAAPDVGWPDIFNSGVMALTPSQASFDQLMQLQKTTGSWDGGDQGLLNEWRGGNWNRISFTYNTTPTAAYTYAPAYERFGSKISAIHFIGPNKPWKSIPYRAPGSESFRQKIEDGQHAYDYSSLVDRWFAVYDRHYRVSAVPSAGLPRFEVPRYQATWDEGTSLGAEVLPSVFTPAGAINRPGPFAGASGPSALALGLYPGPVGGPVAAGAQVGGSLGLDDLRRLAVEGMTAASSPFGGGNGLGEYLSMPLDGRIDLMRPKRAQPPALAGDAENGELASKQGAQTPAEGQQRQRHSGDDGHRPPPGGHGGPPPPPGGQGGSHENGSHSGHQQWFRNSDSHSSGNGDSPQYHGGQGNAGRQYYGNGYYQSPSDSDSHPGSSLFLHLPNQSTPRMDTLPTPDPRDFPPAPRPHTRTLPPSPKHGLSHHRHPSPHPNHPSFHLYQEQHAPHAHYVSHSGPPRLHHHDGSGQQHHASEGHSYVHQQRARAPLGQLEHHHNAEHDRHGGPHHHHRHSLPQRPPSPPMLVWNAAVDPPPNFPPPPSAFPSDTYFQNAWDQQEQQRHSPHHSPNGEGKPEEAPFFDAPPPPIIPETLLQQGHYQNVTGPAAEDRPGHHVAPIPDRSKVKPLFPWEEQPRHIPNRVFPKTDSPPPSAVFLEERKPPTPPPVVPAPPPPAPPLSRRQSQNHGIMSPPGVFPSTITYRNAWDGVPAIQKYASKLVRPEDLPLMPRKPIPSFDRSDYMQSREWEKQSEIGSQDADDEDEDEDEDERGRGRPSGRSRSSNEEERVKDVDLVQEGVQTPRPDGQIGSLPRWSAAVRPLSGTGTMSPTQSFLVSRKQKEYRDMGVQTDVVETRAKAVQVATQVSTLRPSAPAMIRKTSSRPQSASSGMARPGLGDVRRDSFSRTSARAGLGLGPVGEEVGRSRVESLPTRRGGTPLSLADPPSSLAPPAFIRTDSRRSERRMSNPSPMGPPMLPSFAATAGGSPGNGALSPRMVSPPKPPVVPRLPKLSTSSSTSGGASELLTPLSGRPGFGALGFGRPKLPAIGVERSMSGASVDTAILSPPDSVAPSTPFDTMQPFGSVGSAAGAGGSFRKGGGRAWDPNTGVDVIKRGSEQVLARFLRLSSWEDEEAPGAAGER